MNLLLLGLLGCANGGQNNCRPSCRPRCCDRCEPKPKPCECRCPERPQPTCPPTCGNYCPQPRCRYCASPCERPTCPVPPATVEEMTCAVNRCLQKVCGSAPLNLGQLVHSGSATLSGYALNLGVGMYRISYSFDYCGAPFEAGFADYPATVYQSNGGSGTAKGSATIRTNGGELVLGIMSSDCVCVTNLVVKVEKIA